MMRALNGNYPFDEESMKHDSVPNRLQDSAQFEKFLQKPRGPNDAEPREEDREQSP